MPKKDMVLVVGSINIDMVMRSSRMPAPGETIFGEGFKTSYGGKGANQAVAAAKLGGHVYMIGKVGKDAFGSEILLNLQAQGVDCSAVTATEEASTGTAMIIVDSNGENAIVVSSGANWLVTPDDDIIPNEALFEQAAVVLLQLELPLPAVRAAIELAKRHNCKVILDPAPAMLPMPQDLFDVDIFTPNTSETESITQSRVRNATEEKTAATDLIGRGSESVVLKLGPRGCLVVCRDEHIYTVPPYKVNVVDTTAAGDAFTGALATAIAKGFHIRQAAKFANAAGALACTKIGSQSSMPTADEVAILMEDQNID